MKSLSSTMKARIGESFVAVAIVGAGWQFLLRPAERSLAEDREMLAVQRAQIEDATALSPSFAVIESDAAKGEEVLRSLQAAESVSAVSARLYDAVNRLAASQSVKVLRLDPTGLRQVGGSRSGSQPVGARGEVQEYRITVQGPYQAVARFIHSCEHSLGMSSVTKFRISTVEDSPKGDVEATIETAHLRVLASESETKP